MRIVLDTNVLVSGLLRGASPPGEIVRWIALGEVELCFDSRILSEYRDVLLRPKFLLETHRVLALLEQIMAAGHAVAAPPLKLELPDPDDLPFYEAAVAAGARFLVTGNVRHFPIDRRFEVQVVTPRGFVDAMRGA